MDIRNICDDCANCEDRNKSISFCFDVCMAPLNAIEEKEQSRNTKKSDEITEYYLGYRQALKDVCDIMNDCKWPEDLEMELYDFMKEKGMKGELNKS